MAEQEGTSEGIEAIEVSDGDPTPSDPQVVQVGATSDGDTIVLITTGPFTSVQAAYHYRLAEEVHAALGKALERARAMRAGIVLPDQIQKKGPFRGARKG